MSELLERINKLQTEIDQLRQELDNLPKPGFIERNKLYSGVLLLDNSKIPFVNRILFVDNLNRFFSFDLDGTGTRSNTEIAELPMLGVPFAVGNCTYVFKGNLQ